MVASLSDIRHGFYINLDRRPDRRAWMEEEQLPLVGLQHCVRRFAAIERPDGALGCTLSHLSLLRQACAEKWDHLLVLEDDVWFAQPEVFVRQCNRALRLAEGRWDVLLLAGNTASPARPVPGTQGACVQVSRCQTTTAYLVRGAYLPVLLQNVEEGLRRLQAQPSERSRFAIDRHWFELQLRDTWLLVTPLTVAQREDYSDIEQRRVNYVRAMRMLHKPAHLCLAADTGADENHAG